MNVKSAPGGLGPRPSRGSRKPGAARRFLGDARGHLLAISVAVLAAACSGGSAEQALDKAKQHLSGGDGKAAVIELKNALQRNPSLGEARYLLGKTLLDSGDLAGAEVELEKARELSYAAPGLDVAHARLLLAKNQSQKLIDTYAQKTLSDPKAMAELQNLLAAAYASLDKFADAERLSALAMQAAPDDASVMMLQAKLLARAGKFDDAVALIDKALKAQPKDPALWLQKAELLNAREPRSEAVTAVLREAVKQLPEATVLRGALARVLLETRQLDLAQVELDALQKQQPKSPQTALLQALMAMERGEYRKAHELAQGLLKVMPDNPAVLHLAGGAEFQIGELNQAESHVGKALQFNPSNADALRTLLARIQLRQGTVDKALATLQPLLDAKRPKASVYGVAAEIYMRRGEVDKAEAMLVKAADADPDDVGSRIALAAVAIGKGRYQEGVDELRRLAANDARGTADLALIGALMRRGEHAKALEAIAQLERKQPKLPAAPLLRGQVELARGDAAAARKAFEQAQKVAPNALGVLQALAALDVKEGQGQAAVQRFEAAIKAAPEDRSLPLALVQLRARLGTPSADLIRELQALTKLQPDAVEAWQILIRQQLRDRSALKAALDSAQRANAANPDNGPLLELLGQVQLAMGDANQALSTFNKMAAVMPQSAQPLVLVADAHLANKDKPAALQAIKKALALQPDHPRALETFVGLELESGQTKEVMDIARKLQSTKATQLRGLALEADVESWRKNWDGAVAVYRKALELQPASEFAIKLHRNLLAAKRDGEARQFSTNWQSRYPKDAAFVYYLGDLALAQGQNEQAMEQYNRVLKLIPDHPGALNNVAWLLYRSGKPGAQAMAEKANQLQPGNPAFMDTLAAILAAGGQMDKAIALQEQAVALLPQAHHHRLNLARFYITVGKKDKAREELKRLAELGDRYAEIAEVRKLQASLQ